MGFSRQEYWSGLPFPSPGDLPNPGIEPRSPVLQADASPSKPLLQLSKPLIQFSIVGWSYVPSLLFTWGQTMVEVVKIMETSFKRSHACATRLSAHNAAAGLHRPTPPLKTPGHSLASLGQSLVGSMLLFPWPWCAQGSVCAFHGSISQSCVSSGSSMAGLMVTSSKRACAIPRSETPEPLPSWQATVDQYLHRRHSKPSLTQSLWDLLVCTRFCLSLLSVSGGYGI